VLEKKFWFRKSRDWAGLVSEPVKINWKKGKDLTGGLTDAAYKMGEARKKLNSDSSDMAARKKETQLPEYKQLSEKIETALESSISFFGLFAFVSGYRWVSAEESAKVEKEDKEKLEKIKRGEKIDEDEDEEEDPQDYQEIEVFPGGDEVVTIIAEDMWPNAIKYYSMLPEPEPYGYANKSQRRRSTRKKMTRTCLIWTLRVWTTQKPSPWSKTTLKTRKSIFVLWLAKAGNPMQRHLLRSSARSRVLMPA
jgi:hypothetical protein